MIEKLLEIYYIFLYKYHFQNWWPAQSPFEIIIGSILTQNISWRNVEKAINNLKTKNLLHPEKLIKTPLNVVGNLIKPTGFYNQKAKKIMNFLYFFSKYDFSIEKLKVKSIYSIRKELLDVKGIGKETADSIILYALYKPIFVIDAYTKRLFYRLGVLYSEKMEYDEIRKFFEKNLPKDVILFQDYHAQIVFHSKNICQKKPLCSQCLLTNFCQFDKVV